MARSRNAQQECNSPRRLRSSEISHDISVRYVCINCMQSDVQRDEHARCGLGFGSALYAAASLAGLAGGSIASSRQLGLCPDRFPRRWMRGSSPRMTTHRVSTCGRRTGGPAAFALHHVEDVGSLNPHVPLFAAGVALGVTVAILVAVCMWPSQRLAKGAAISNWSSTRATMWLTMSSTVCGWL